MTINRRELILAEELGNCVFDDISSDVEGTADL